MRLKGCGDGKAHTVGGGYGTANASDAEDTLFGLAEVERNAGGVPHKGSGNIEIMQPTGRIWIAVIPVVTDRDEPFRTDGIFQHTIDMTAVVIFGV